jgi:hypothetical protein
METVAVFIGMVTLFIGMMFLDRRRRALELDLADPQAPLLGPECDAPLAALGRGDPAAVCALLNRVRAEVGFSDHDFLLSELGKAAPVDRVRGLADAHPQNQLLQLLAGSACIAAAWQARGSAGAEDTSDDQFSAFLALLEHADAYLCAAEALGTGWPSAPYLQLFVALGQDAEIEDREALIAQVRARDAGHVPVGWAGVTVLCRKWGGGDEQMEAFARDTAAAAHSDSPLRAVELPALAELGLARTWKKRGPSIEALQARWVALQDRMPAADTRSRQRCWALVDMSGFWFHIWLDDKEPAARHRRDAKAWLARFI